MYKPKGEIILKANLPKVFYLIGVPQISGSSFILPGTRRTILV